MTDKPIPNEKMKLIEYAENCYRGEPLTNKLFARIPKRLSVWIETKALIDGVNTSVITRYALEKYASANGYDPHHKL